MKAQTVPDSRGLDPGIHQKRIFRFKGMDCRVKPGNDARRVNVHEGWYDGPSMVMAKL